MAINQSILRNKAMSFNQTIYESKQATASYKQRKSAFLCHSHKDEVLVKGLLALFDEIEIDLYIDWKDHTMPDTPNVETAKKIQDKIISCDLFLFLATANSKESRWCPWEIGFGDSSKRSIYIIPTTDSYNTYGNEYLELYSRIDIGTYEKQDVYAIFEAGNRNARFLSTSNLR